MKPGKDYSENTGRKRRTKTERCPKKLLYLPKRNMNLHYKTCLHTKGDFVLIS
jgi:hypothetical protein